MRAAQLGLLLLWVVAFDLAIRLDAWILPPNNAAESGDFAAAVMGESRRVLASHFFVQADVYFHNGYYPSAFDQAELNEGDHLISASHEGHVIEADHDMPHQSATAVHHDEHGHDERADFLGLALDPIDRFGRNFYPSKHVHAEGIQARELLPWLRLSAELDPQNVATYTVAAFWLRGQMGKVDEAEAFLREGWRQNPDSPEILLELGRVYSENRRDVRRARNVWELAAEKWKKQEPPKKEPNYFLWQRIAGNLAQLEEQSGNFSRSAEWLESMEERSPNPKIIRQHIESLRQKAGDAARQPR